jgi:tetratricopeptide (TPR) repeat protein
MTDISQCYRILGAKPDADSTELKQAYRDLVKIWHPDRFQGDTRLQQKAQEQLKKINSAYRQIVAGTSESRPTDCQTDRKSEHRTATVHRPPAKPRRLVARILLFLFLSAVGLSSLLLVQKDLAEICFNFGTIFLDSGRSHEALYALKAARWMNPGNPKVHLALGNAYYGMKIYGQAEKAYREALSKNQQLEEPQHQLALLYIHRGAIDPAIELLEKAVRVNPSSAVLFNDLGFAYGMHGAQSEELEAYGRAIRIKPEFEAAHFNFALAKLRLGDYPAVYTELEVLRALAPSLADRLLSLIKEK